MSTSTPPPAGRRRPRSTTPGAIVAAALFEPGLDRSAIERMLLAFATHRLGAGFSRVSLLVWNPDREALEGRLCWTASLTSRTLDESLAVARWQASDGTDPEATRVLRALRLDPAELDGALSRVWVAGGCGVCDPAPSRQHPWDAAAGVGVVALRHGTCAYGLLIGEWSASGDSEDAERRKRALEALRSLGNAALGAHAASEGARRGEARLAALHQFARATVSPLNVAEANQALVRLACEGAGARGAALWRIAAVRKGDRSPELELVTSYGPAGVRERLGRGLLPIASACVAEERKLVLGRALDVPALSPSVAAQITAVAAVPVIAYGRPLGALAVYDRALQHPGDSAAFDPDDVRFLEALADQGAMAFHQAGTEEARRQAEQARRDLLQQLSRSERLAASCEIWVRLAHEARNPLASIAAFARRVHRSLGESDPNREYLEVVVREADRLERAFAGPLQMAGADGPRLEMQSVNALLQGALQQVAEPLVRRRVRLLKKLAPDLPALLLDTAKIGAAFQNILGHALDRVGPGGRIRLETRRVQQYVVVEIANDGRAEPGELMGDLFVPFQLGGGGGGGGETGLALARQIVLLHGGEVRTRREGEWSTVFLLTFPIPGNEDRRLPGSTRRVARRDRRQQRPAP